MTESRTTTDLFRPVAPVPPPRRPSWPRVLRGLLRADFSHFSDRAYRKTVYSFAVPGRRIHLPVRPAATRQVLVDQQSNYPKSRLMQRLLGPLINDGMFVANGETWARKRRMLEPTLELSRLKVFLPLMQGAVDDMIDRLRARNDPVMDVDVETMRVTADILARTMFSERVTAPFVDEVAEAFRRYQASAPELLTVSVLGLPFWCLPHRVLARRRWARRIRGMLATLVRQRLEMADGDRPDDLLTSMIRAQDAPTGHRFSEAELIDEVVIFFIAGHETSASALSWALYLLANDRRAQDRLALEVSQTVPPGPVAFSDLRKLRFTRDVFREALRLYPPVTAYLRDPVAQGVIGKTDVSGRDMVAVVPWFVHRSPENWAHPDRFDPDRFQTDSGRASLRKSYVPFNTGPRACSGAAFATQEALLILSAIIRTFDVSPVPGHEPQPAAWFTQRSRNGVWLRLTPRDPGAGC